MSCSSCAWAILDNHRQHHTGQPHSDALSGSALRWVGLYPPRGCKQGWQGSRTVLLCDLPLRASQTGHCCVTCLVPYCFLYHPLSESYKLPTIQTRRHLCGARTSHFSLVRNGRVHSSQGLNTPDPPSTVTNCDLF